MAILDFSAISCHAKLQDSFKADLYTYEQQEQGDTLWVERTTTYTGSDGTTRSLPLDGPVRAEFYYRSFHFKDLRWQAKGTYDLFFTLKSQKHGELAKCGVPITIS